MNKRFKKTENRRDVEQSSKENVEIMTKTYINCRIRDKHQ